MRRLFISEGKQVGIIYHHTYTVTALIELDYSSTMITELISSIINDGLISTRYNYISFSRNFSLLSDEGTDGAPWGVVRIVVDGDSLSNKHKIEPYMDYDFVGIKRTSGENEERVVWPHGTYLPIVKYILEIDILLLKGTDNKDDAIEASFALRSKYPAINFKLVNSYTRYR